MKEITNLDIIFEMYEKLYIKKEEEEKSSYHEITNFDIIFYISKKIEEKTEMMKKLEKNKSDEMKSSFFNGRLGTSK
ncbi:MAG: hypothetical protein ACLTXO_09190 [Fusobacterium varium]|uniref:hypothetical protein n=1 Tax=Fusobacterium varium TaxID=856 RepID=UPI003993A645